MPIKEIRGGKAVIGTLPRAFPKPAIVPMAGNAGRGRTCKLRLRRPTRYPIGPRGRDSGSPDSSALANLELRSCIARAREILRNFFMNGRVTVTLTDRPTPS